MNGEELPCLDISGFYLNLWLGYFKGIRVSDDGQVIGIEGSGLVLTILTSQNLPCSAYVFGCG